MFYWVSDLHKAADFPNGRHFNENNIFSSFFTLQDMFIMVKISLTRLYKCFGLKWADLPRRQIGHYSEILNCSAKRTYVRSAGFRRGLLMQSIKGGWPYDQCSGVSQFPKYTLKTEVKSPYESKMANQLEHSHLLQIMEPQIVEEYISFSLREVYLFFASKTS